MSLSQLRLRGDRTEATDYISAPHAARSGQDEAWLNQVIRAYHRHDLNHAGFGSYLLKFDHLREDGKMTFRKAHGGTVTASRVFAVAWQEKGIIAYPHFFSRILEALGWTTGPNTSLPASSPSKSCGPSASSRKALADDPSQWGSLRA